jgi:DNA invertase Pin-like site-specific DNA recombinase
MNELRLGGRNFFHRYLCESCRRFGGADLRASEAAADRITEKVSSIAPRKAREEAMDYAREGGALCVTKLDRLARSVAHLCELVARLQAKRVALRILNMNIDTGTPAGKLMLNRWLDRRARTRRHA